MTKNGDFGLTSTDHPGLFMFQDFEYPDSTSFFIQAQSKSGSNRVELVLDGESFPKTIHATQSPRLTPALSKGEGERERVIRDESKTETVPNAFLSKAEQRARYDETMWMINLSEIEVIARRIEKKDGPRLQFWANAVSDVTIRRDEIEKLALNSVTEMLGRVPGVNVLPNGQISIRASGSVSGGYKPIVLIDGISVEWPPDNMITRFNSPLESVHANDVESIDVFKGTSAAAFGGRGAGGAISITTRRAGTDRNRENRDFNHTVYTPLGYQKPVEFYAPVYETLESKHLSNPDYRTTVKLIIK